MSLQYCGSVFSGQVYCGLIELGKNIRPGLFQKHALCDCVLVCISFSRNLALLNFNFFSPLLF